MASVITNIGTVVSLTVDPVRFLKQRLSLDHAEYTFATQWIHLVVDDGSRLSLVLHLADGCPQLAAGEPVVLPNVAELEGAKP